MKEEDIMKANITFEELIIFLRKEHELSRVKLAELIGVSDKIIQRWENGDSRPKLLNLVKLSKIFNISIDSMLFI